MAPAGPGGQLTQEIIRVTCSHFGSHSASSHRPEQQQPSSQPEVSGAMGQEESRSEEMDLAQIQELCILFMKECPSGALHLHEFKRIFGVPSSSAEESLYIETIFRSFDTNQVRGRDPASGLWAPGSVFSAHFVFCLQDNTLDFLEYVAALHLILRGNLEDRLKWSFKMYDKDGNGKLDRHEVKRLIKVRPSIRPSEQNSHLEPGLS